MRHLTYLALLAGCLLLTVPLDRRYRAGVFRRPRQLALAIAPGLLLFGGWDLYAIGHGHWSYDLAWMTGVMLPGRLPVEEALFFVVVPLAAILTYQCVRVSCERRTAKAGLADRATDPVQAGRTAEVAGRATEPVQASRTDR